jgi:type IV pilus assembly protein PilB
MKFINLSEMNIPPTIIEMLPESVERENVLIPIAEKNGVLQIVMKDPFDYDTILKVQYILARDIEPALASEEHIIAAIDRHFGKL